MGRVHRKPLLELLERYRAQRPGEAACADRIRSLVASRSDCFSRGCAPGHVTGSAFVVSADGRRTLLVQHRKLGVWLQPGGHADGDPDVAAVALREAREETGLAGLALWPAGGEGLPLDLDVHTIPARPGEPEHEHHDVRFLVVAGPDETPVASPESLALRWVELEALAGFGVDEGVLRMARKARGLLAAGSRGDA